MPLSDGDLRLIPKHKVWRTRWDGWHWTCGFCGEWDHLWTHWRDAFGQLERHHNLCCRMLWESRTAL